MNADIPSEVKSLASGNIVRTFTAAKETPGTIKYNEDELPGQPPVLRNVYVAKYIARGHNRVRVTVELL